MSIGQGGANVFVLDGAGAGTIGIDVSDTDVELRAVVVQNFVDRGVRIRNGSTSQVIDVRLTSCRLASNGAEGLDVDLAAPLTLGSRGGFFDVGVVGSLFEGNASAGLLID